MEPHVAGEPTPIATAFAQLSLGGGAAPVIVTVWLHVVTLLQQSVACHVRVITWEHGPAPLVTVLTTITVTLVPQQTSTAVGGSKFQATLHWTLLPSAQVRVGGIVSMTVTV